ncbi:MAG: hypothetical protein ABI467_03655, partial [Kofleriaceae bacterium]
MRFLLARDSNLLGWVVTRFLAKVFAWQRRRARRLGLVDPLPPPSDAEVGRLLAQIARTIHARVERLAEDDDEPPDALAHDQAAALSEPALARFAAVSSASRRTAFVEGYSLHADREIDVD